VDAKVGTQVVAVLHQQMPAETQLRLLAVGLDQWFGRDAGPPVWLTKLLKEGRELLEHPIRMTLDGMQLMIRLPGGVEVKTVKKSG
jgi:hypothetical protein